MVTHKNILLLLLTSADSTGLSAEGITGRVLLIVTVVIGLLVWALLVAAFAYLICKDGNHLSVHLIHILLCGRTCKTLLSCCFTYVVNYTSLVVTIMELSKLYCSFIPRVSCVDGEKGLVHTVCACSVPAGFLGI